MIKIARAVSTNVKPYAKRKSVFAFPGQGAQHVGMALDVYDNFKVAQHIMNEADEAVGGGLKKLMFSGPQSELTLTKNAQPAILCHSIALNEVLKTEFGIDMLKSTKFAIGHSLGEYSALVSLGCISLADAVALVRLRGETMQRAVLLAKRPTSMQAAIIWGDHLADIERVMPEIQKKALEKGDIVNLANINGKSQVVLSGTVAGVEMASDALQSLHYTGRTIKLPVSAPFHCELMAPAAQEMKSALNKIQINPIPEHLQMISNVTGMPMPRDPQSIRNLLIQQMTSTVQWHRCVSFCLDHDADNFFVIGPSRALANLLKKELPASKNVIPIMTAADLQKNAQQLNLLREICIGPKLPFPSKSGDPRKLL